MNASPLGDLVNRIAGDAVNALKHTITNAPNPLPATPAPTLHILPTETAPQPGPPPPHPPEPKKDEPKKQELKKEEPKKNAELKKETAKPKEEPEKPQPAREAHKSTHSSPPAASKEEKKPAESSGDWESPDTVKAIADAKTEEEQERKLIKDRDRKDCCG